MVFKFGAPKISKRGAFRDQSHDAGPTGWLIAVTQQSASVLQKLKLAGSRSNFHDYLSTVLLLILTTYGFYPISQTRCRRQAEGTADMSTRLHVHILACSSRIGKSTDSAHPKSDLIRQIAGLSWAFEWERGKHDPGFAAAEHWI